MLVILPIFTIACTCNSADNTQPEPYFPVQKEVAEEVMQARLEGKLVMDDAGYLRVYDALIIWPHGYSLKIEGKEIWIINDKGQAVARVGDMVMVGGGFVDTWVAEEKIGCALPEDAKGPCWLAGNVIKDSN
ncbi:MAG TPA: hypothetical protein VGA85_00070 [Dehalococcoidales bacterium]